MTRELHHPPVVLFVRHAEAIWTNKKLPGRLSGIDLSTKGREQAEVLAEALSRLPISEIHSSPLERALQTAEPLAKTLGISIIEDSDLIEADCGDWAGRSFRQVARMRSYKELVGNPVLRRPPGGETIVEVQARMLRFVERVKYSPRGRLVAAFSHADPIKAVVAGLIGLPIELYRRIELGVASVSAFVLHDDPLMLCVNGDGGRIATAYSDYVAIRSRRKPPA
jgi:broad specificity phosphatase PhoE